MFDPSLRGKQLSSLWWGCRHNCTSGSRYNGAYIKAVGVLNQRSSLVSKQKFLRHPQDSKYYHYSEVDQLEIDAQRRASCRSRSELEIWQPQDSKNEKVRIAAARQNLVYLADKILGNVSKIIGFWHVFMSEQVLVRVFRFVAIPQKQFEEMKQAQEVEFANGTLERDDITRYRIP
jgi:hypothetical protein